MPEPERSCRRVIYRGQVQGVGFRHMAWVLSRGRPVAGYVRNLGDGSVELIVVAADDAFDAFHRSIQQAFAGYITDVAIAPFDAGDEFESFSIRR